MPPKNSKCNKTSLRKRKSPKVVKNVSRMVTRRKRPEPAENKELEPVPSTSDDFEPCYFSLAKNKTKEDKKEVEPVPSTSASSEPTAKKTTSKYSSASASSEPIAEKKNSKYDTSTSASSEPTAEKKTSKYDSYVLTPKIIKSRLNAYKLSPDYENLKKKRFNTSFRHETPRGDREIEIFSPEEEAEFLRENPIVDHGFHYGDKTANVFMSIPELNIDDVEEEMAAIKAKEAKSKKQIKRGRKKSIGYKGVPFADDGLSLTEFNTLLMLTP